MAHIHGNEYQVISVRRDGTEDLSEWLQSVEQIALAIAVSSKPQDRAYWVRARNIVCAACAGVEQMIMECPITNIPSARCGPLDPRRRMETGTKSRHEVNSVPRNGHRVA